MVQKKTTTLFRQDLRIFATWCCPSSQTPCLQIHSLSSYTPCITSPRQLHVYVAVPSNCIQHTRANPAVQFLPLGGLPMLFFPGTVAVREESEPQPPGSSCPWLWERGGSPLGHWGPSLKTLCALTLHSCKLSLQENAPVTFFTPHQTTLHLLEKEGNRCIWWRALAKEKDLHSIF